MRFAQVPREASTTEPPGAGSVVLVIIENDSVISNQTAQQVLDQWEANGANIEEFIFPTEFGVPHDVIDIHQEKGHPELVYPILIDLVEGFTPVIPLGLISDQELFTSSPAWAGTATPQPGGWFGSAHYPPGRRLCAPA